MAYRNLMLTSPARVSCKNAQLVVETDQIVSFPIEDLCSVLIESRQCSITTAALAALVQNGTTVYLCDEKHLPCGVALPFAQNCRQLEVARMQMEWTAPVKKRLWQQIVRRKIQNQAECLRLCGKTEQAASLEKRVELVTSGDKYNIEATAAAFYFKGLFGDGFTRGNEEDTRNAALNYGYAILRGCMARCLCSYGWIPWLGLHHDSTLNQFNLADDMMEPYRPMVDLFVAAQVAWDAVLDRGLKSQLYNLLNLDVQMKEKHYAAAYAMERQVQSLRRPQEPMLLPRLLPARQHTYE